MRSIRSCQGVGDLRRLLRHDVPELFGTYILDANRQPRRARFLRSERPGWLAMGYHRGRRAVPFRRDLMAVDSVG